MMRTVGAGLAALALAGMAAPAAAGDRKPRRHQRHQDKVDAGDIVAGAVLLGALALLTKKKRAAPPIAPTIAEPIATALTEDEATDACGRAAEVEGGRLAPVVHTDRVDRVDAAGDGWVIRGFVALRDGYRQATPATMRGFRCSIATTGVPRVQFDGDDVAALEPVG